MNEQHKGSISLKRTVELIVKIDILYRRNMRICVGNGGQWLLSADGEGIGKETGGKRYRHNEQYSHLKSRHDSPTLLSMRVT